VRGRNLYVGNIEPTLARLYTNHTILNSDCVELSQPGTWILCFKLLALSTSETQKRIIRGSQPHCKYLRRLKLGLINEKWWWQHGVRCGTEVQNKSLLRLPILENGLGAHRLGIYTAYAPPAS